MIIKQRENSLLLAQLTALDRRIPVYHKMKETVQIDLRKRKSGERGEQAVEFPLRFLNEQDYLILHDLRLCDANGFFQIDTLILCERFILILEVKNWSGTIVFGESGQVTRIDNELKEEGFPNPIPQAKLQRHRLHKWLNNHGLLNIPIAYFVVISFPSTIIKSTTTEPVPQQIVHNNQLFFRIKELDQVYAPKIAGMRQLARRLANAHVPESIMIMEKYGISARELIKSVYCPECCSMPMSRKVIKWWYCVKCQY